MPPKALETGHSTLSSFLGEELFLTGKFFLDAEQYWLGDGMMQAL